ncbi:MAG: 50S ribosomal protein L16 [Candidatus Parcubacteria bacterium]|nr:50S ribosomal protein L16 [Candidatus Parcubacteria bacterium]
MFIPKKVKHRKWNKGRNRGRAFDTRGVSLNYGTYGLKAEGSAWIDSRQLESCRRAIMRIMQKGGKIWMRVFPDKPVTKKPPEVTLGGGKGAVDHYVFPVRAGRILFEIDGVSEEIAKKAFKMASYKLPIKVRVVKSEK